MATPVVRWLSGRFAWPSLQVATLEPGKLTDEVLWVLLCRRYGRDTDTALSISCLAFSALVGPSKDDDRALAVFDIELANDELRLRGALNALRLAGRISPLLCDTGKVDDEFEAASSASRPARAERGPVSATIPGLFSM